MKYSQSIALLLVIGIMESKSLYQELDRDELIHTFSKILDRVSPQIILPLNDVKV